MTSLQWTSYSVWNPRPVSKSFHSVALRPNVSRCRINFELSVTRSDPTKPHLIIHSSLRGPVHVGGFRRGDVSAVPVFVRVPLKPQRLICSSNISHRLWRVQSLLFSRHRLLFVGVKVDWAWTWPLTSVWCRGKEWVELCSLSPIRLNGVPKDSFYLTRLQVKNRHSVSISHMLPLQPEQHSCKHLASDVNRFSVTPTASAEHYESLLLYKNV